MIPKKKPSKPPDKRIKEGEWKRKRIRYLTGQVVVKFKPRPEDSAQAVKNLCEEIAKSLPKGTVKRFPRATGRAVFTFDSKESVFQLAKELSKRDDVAYAEPDIVDSAAQLVPTDTRYGDQWGLAQVGAPNAWDLETGTANVLIGIIDSGISINALNNLDHPDLNDPVRYTLGTDYVDGGTPRDTYGHGTHVTGIAAAESNNTQGIAGMSWNSPVYICRTLDVWGNGSSADFADAVEEIVDYAVAHSLKAVINYSAGGGDNQTKRDACQYIEDHGMILCAATGNDNGGAVIYPAAYSTMYDGVIAVGSTDDDDTVSGFSNVGPEVTVVAPGRDILSTMPMYAVTIPAAIAYDELDGTSMATPLVTGLVSLMWSRHPGFTNKKIKDCLIKTAIKLGAGDFNNDWGYGRIDAEEALRCGDWVFPPFTHYTRFTIFTRFTMLTRFTYFTLFTYLTHITHFTRFSYFTLLTHFTKFTRITRFTRFTKFPHFTRFFDRFRRLVKPSSFLRVGKTVFEPREVAIRNFKELEATEKNLARIGIHYLHELASCDQARLTKALNYTPEEVSTLVKLSKQLLSELAQN